MDKQVIDFEVNNICEAYGCFQKAKEIKPEQTEDGIASQHSVCHDCSISPNYHQGDDMN